MPKRRLTWIWIVIIIVFLLALTALAVYLSQPSKPLPDPGPQVFITNPKLEGLTAPLEVIEVTAIARGEQPIHRLELWLDGQLAQTYFNPDPSQAAPVQVSFSQPLKSGGHLIIVRAVDTYQLIGQSLPFTAMGALEVSGEGPHTLVTASTEDLPTTEGSPATGSTIALPIPTGEKESQADPPPPPGNPTILDLIKLLPGANPPLQIIPGRVFGPPPSPTNLEVSTADCSLKFTWQDTSKVEAGFQIWVTGLGISPRVAALIKEAPETGPVAVEIPALGKGDYVYWVEAYNFAGAQPSNQVFVSVNDPCPNQLSGSLAVEMIDFQAPSQYDRTYCYVSLLDNPEVRLPAGQDQFIPLSGGSGNLTAIPLEARSYKIPVSEQDLKLQGECWGWTGANLSKMGPFSQIIPPTQWNGSRIPLGGQNYEIGLKLTLTSGELVPFAAPDPGIPAPKLISMEKTVSLADVGLDPMDTLNYLDQGDKRLLVWEWFPPATWNEKLTGFTVLINGIPTQQINDPLSRTTEIQVPGFCGTEIKVSLVANIADRQSLPGNQLADHQDPCQLYAVVDFKSVHFGWVNDSLNPGNQCDKVQTFFHISVSEYFNRGQGTEVKGIKLIKHFNGGGFYQEVRCGIYDLNHLAGPAATAKELDPTKLVVPIRLIEGQNTDYEIESTIWDYDSGSGNDVVARYLGTIFFNPGMVDGLLAKMQDNPAKLDDYFCDAYIATFNGDAKSKIDICVDLYAQNPSSGAASLPDNTPPFDPIGSGPGQQYNTNSDLALTGIYLKSDGSLAARIQNQGSEDLGTARLEFTTTIQSNAAGISGTPWTYQKTVVGLKNGSQMEFMIWPWDKLDPTQYNYTITVELGGTGFSDPVPANNKKTESWTGLPAAPEPLKADLKIASVRANGEGGLAVTLENGGPDAIQQNQATVNCEATQVSRTDGSSTKITDLEKTNIINLNVQDQKRFILTSQSGSVNLLTSWYLASCQVNTDGTYQDPDPANNFINQVIP